MEERKGQFRCRKIKGVTEVRLPDDRRLRRQVLRAFRNLAPLFDDCIPGEPSFDDLKANPDFKRFLHSLEGESELILYLSARHGANLEKAVAILDESGCVFAVVHWKAEDDSVEFKVFN